VGEEIVHGASGCRLAFLFCPATFLCSRRPQVGGSLWRQIGRVLAVLPFILQQQFLLRNTRRLHNPEGATGNRRLSPAAVPTI